MSGLIYNITVDGQVKSSREEMRFKTMTEALDFTEGLEDDAEKIISIMPGRYCEQLRVNAANVMFCPVEGAEGEVKLTWYYGIGYLYNSVGADGHFDPLNGAFGNKVERWGCAVWIREGATNFRAKNITFENSFNQYVCDEEIADNVTPAPIIDGETIYKSRVETKSRVGVSDFDIQTRAYRERGAAIYVEADRVIFENCRFIGMQDTLGDMKGRHYYKNCYIQGTADYICGAGTSVFDNCTLMSAASPKQTDEDFTFISASKVQEGLGFLFIDCNVKAFPTAKAKHTYWGRPWGGSTSQATFINTTVPEVCGEPILADFGWALIGKNPSLEGRFYEQNTRTESGRLLDATQRTKNVYDESVPSTPFDYTKGSDNWKPLFV